MCGLYFSFEQDSPIKIWCALASYPGSQWAGNQPCTYPDFWWAGNQPRTQALGGRREPGYEARGDYTAWGGDNKGMCVEPNETMRGWVWRERQNVVMSIRSNMEVNKGMGVERETLRGWVWGERH